MYENRILKVILLGRPNVGKSTIFNRLAGKRIAIVNKKPGTTRDLNFAIVKHNQHRYLLIDSAGIGDFLLLSVIRLLGIIL